MTFIIGILIVSIIFSLQPFVKKNIMTEFTIDEYTVYSPLIALIIFLIGSIFKGLDFKDLKSKSLISYGYLILASLMTLSYSYILNMLIKEYNVGSVVPYIRCGEMIWIFLITLIINYKSINYKSILGLLLVVTGIYITPSNN